MAEGDLLYSRGFEEPMRGPYCGSCFEEWEPNHRCAPRRRVPVEFAQQPRTAEQVVIRPRSSSPFLEPVEQRTDWSPPWWACVLMGAGFVANVFLWSLVIGAR